MREIAEPVPSRVLGGIHRLVGVSEQVFHPGGIVGIQRDTDAGRNIGYFFFQAEGVGQALPDALGDPPDIAGVIQFRQDDDEFVPAQARHGVGFAHAVADASRRLFQQQVAHVVPERVVDLLELVEVDEHQRHFQAGAVRFLDLLRQPVMEHAAVGQAGQRIVVGLVPDQFLGCFPAGDVADKPIEFILARRVDCGNGQFDGEFAAIAVQPQHLDPRIQDSPFAGGQKMLQAFDMRLAVLGRDDGFAQYPPDSFFLRPAENLFRLIAPAGDDALGIHLHHGIQGGIDDGAQACLVCTVHFKQIAEAFGHFVEAFGYLTEFITRAQVGPHTQIAAGKGAKGMQQRLNVADKGIVEAD